MKQWFLFALLLLVLLPLPSCAAGENSLPSVMLHSLNGETVTPVEPDGIGLAVDSTSVTQSGLTYTLENTTETMIYMGDEFFIVQRQEDGQPEWTELPWIAGQPEWWKTLVGYGPPFGGPEWSVTVDWEGIYGPLPAGEYLLVKEIIDRGDQALNYYIAAEFSVPAS